MSAALADRLPVGRYVLAGCTAVGLLVFVLLGWASGVTLSGAIVVPGVVMSDQQQRNVQHPGGGVLAELRVAEGDQVRAGDVLARLDTSAQAGALAEVEDNMLATALARARMRAQSESASVLIFAPELLNQIAQRPHLLALVTEERALFEARRDSLTAQLRQLAHAETLASQQADGLAGQLTALRRKATVLAEELGNQRDLVSRRLAPSATVVALEKEEAALVGQIEGLESARKEALERVKGTEAERVALRVSVRHQAVEELREATTMARALREDAAQLRREIDQAALRAPADGVVFGMTGHTVRSVLGPAEPLMQIVPAQGGQTILTRVVASDVDQVVLGQAVTLRLSALDQRTTPELRGQVARIAPAPSMDDTSGAAFFNVDVHLPPEELARLPGGVRLLPGMPVETYIRTIDRTPLSYLIKPVRDYFASAFRDG